MGVPAFFRWLTKKYPDIVTDCVEAKGKQLPSGRYVLPDASDPNPNNVEYDNLYLDMNGFIHPCTHPEDRLAPRSEEEMMINIFEYIDRVFSIVRPRKLLYMAIDGVAPRAKMNQQRSRRFQSSKEGEKKEKEISAIRENLVAQGNDVPPQRAERFNSNCITPGTLFMQRLSLCLHYYVHDRLENDPGWKNVTVILSDASVPGEGEHKIMDYIRRQRAQASHDPNTQHVICGADADLILLGLATHERNFTIIREVYKFKRSPCAICGHLSHKTKNCPGAKHEHLSTGSKPEFIFVKLNVLRGHLDQDLRIPNLSFPFDLERAIDDWIFMCFFVGNDFLPHLPYLETKEGAIERLIEMYQKVAQKAKGWVTNMGFIDLERLQMIFDELVLDEEQLLKDRQPPQSKKKKGKSSALQAGGQNAPTGGGPRTSSGNQQGLHYGQAFSRTTPVPSGSSRGVKRKQAYVDPFVLWMNEFKDQYYEVKFADSKRDGTFRAKVTCEYVRGLCWVLQYYYQGVPSWKWFYPYHYAPFASDFRDISSMQTAFEQGTKPFSPLEQLMGVFPPASSSQLPSAWARLMKDPKSPIIDFYPKQFQTHKNGKKNAWQGVTLLPFVDEERLRTAVEPFFETLTEEEKRRNMRGENLIFVGKHHPAYDFLRVLVNDSAKGDTAPIPLKTEYIYGISGLVFRSDLCVQPGGTLDSPVQGLLNLNDCHVVCMGYRDPILTEPNFQLSACRLPLTTPSNLQAVTNPLLEPQPGTSSVAAAVDDSSDLLLQMSGEGSMAETKSAVSASSTAKDIPCMELDSTNIYENSTISHTISINDFYLQVNSDAAKSMAEAISQAEKKPIQEIKVGDTCLAPLRNGVAGVFFRAVVKGIEDTNEDGVIQLFYVDYGYSGSSLLSELMMLPSEIANRPALATRCRLSGRLAASTSLNSEFFKIANKMGPGGVKPTFRATIISKKKNLVEVMLTTGGGEDVMLKCLTPDRDESGSISKKLK